MRIDIFKISIEPIEVGTSDDTVNRFISEFLCNWQNKNHDRQVTFSKNDIPYLIEDYLSRAHVRRKDRGAATAVLTKWMNALPYTNKFITLRVEAYEECNPKIIDERISGQSVDVNFEHYDETGVPSALTPVALERLFDTVGGGIIEQTS